MTDIPHTPDTSASKPSGCEQQPASAEAQALFGLICGNDLRHSANDGALIVFALATFSFLIERFDVTLTEVERRVGEVLAKAENSVLLGRPEVAERCDALLNILHQIYRSPSSGSPSQAAPVLRN
jgi:hypothetical protein